MFPQRESPTQVQIKNNLLKTIDIAHRAKELGNHPFGAVLVGPDNETVLIEQGNINTLNHAESTLCRTAFDQFTQEYLWRCTLYTNFEPCCMCSGSIYWSNIGRVVYGLSEAELLGLTGDDSENMTLSLPCRTIFGSGQKDVEVIGPVATDNEELKATILEDHVSFWRHSQLPTPTKL